MFAGVSEKLKRAEYFLDNLKALADGFTRAEKQQEMRANLDGFFFEVISAKDFFLQGINDNYGLDLKKKQATYPDQLISKLRKRNLNKALEVVTLVEKLLNEKNLRPEQKLQDDQDSWLWRLNNYRNSATHRELLHFGHVVVPGENTNTYLFKDPEDSKKRNADIEVIPYCEQSLAQMKELLERLYSELELEVGAK